MNVSKANLFESFSEHSFTVKVKSIQSFHGYFWMSNICQNLVKSLLRIYQDKLITKNIRTQLERLFIHRDSMLHVFDKQKN